MTQFIFVRHGQTDWNRENRFRGLVDLPLNEKGIEQAQRAAVRLAQTPLAAVYAGPLARTMKTAEFIAAPHGLVAQPRAELLDFNYGAWQGKLPQEVDAEQYALWRTEPDRVQIPGGDTLASVRARVMGLVDALSAAHGDATVVLVSHDLIGKILLCGLIGVSNNAIQRFYQETACIHRFDASNGMYLLRAVNETAHLENDLSPPAPLP